MTTVSFWLLSRMFTGCNKFNPHAQLPSTLIHFQSDEYCSHFRSICLTKNYCSKECSKADEAVHSVCCQNLLEVDKRKWKKGGKAKVEKANQNLDAYLRLNHHNPYVTEVVDKMKKVKVKREEKCSEVD